VAGVTTLQIREELVRLMHDRALRSLSQALGVALADPGEPPSVHPTAVEAKAVLNPATEGGR